MKKLLYLIALLVLVALGATFAIKNPQDIYITYYPNLEWEGPLAVLVLVSLGLGYCLCVLRGIGRNISLRKRISRLEKENRSLEAHISRSKDIINSKQ